MSDFVKNLTQARFGIGLSKSLLKCPGPAPGVNQAGRLATADCVVCGVSQDGAGEPEVGRLTCPARSAGLLVVPSACWLARAPHQSARRLELVDWLIPSLPVLPNNLVCHSPAWLQGRPTPLAWLPMLGALRNLASKRKWVGP